jgi:hypothetical protein
MRRGCQGISHFPKDRNDFFPSHWGGFFPLDYRLGHEPGRSAQDGSRKRFLVVEPKGNAARDEDHNYHDLLPVHKKRS